MPDVNNTHRTTLRRPAHSGGISRAAFADDEAESDRDHLWRELTRASEGLAILTAAVDTAADEIEATVCHVEKHPEDREAGAADIAFYLGALLQSIESAHARAVYLHKSLRQFAAAPQGGKVGARAA